MRGAIMAPPPPSFLSFEATKSPKLSLRQIFWFFSVHRHQKQHPKWKFSGQKWLKFQILSYRRVIYLKRKLRTYTKQIQPEKIRIFANQRIFFNFFDFSRHARGPPKNFDVQFSKHFQKKPKNDSSGTFQFLRGTKSWVLVSLALTLWKRQTDSW